jgi:hypothetical protein
MIPWTALTKKQRLLLVGAVFLVGMAAMLTACFLGIVLAQDSSAGRELALLEQEAGDARTLLEREAFFREELSRSAADLDVLIAQAPSQTDRYAWVYEYVLHCAAQAQITLDTFEEVAVSPDEKTAPANPPYEVRLSTQCGYNSLVELLWRLEKDNPLLRIKKVSISTIPGLTQDPRVQISIQWLTSLEAKRVAL